MHIEPVMPKHRGISLVTSISPGLITAMSALSQPNKITAQNVVEEIKAGHPEISGLELAATKSAADGCRTIAATEAN